MTTFCERYHRAVVLRLLVKSGILILTGLVLSSETLCANSTAENAWTRQTFCQEWATDETIRNMIKMASQQSSPCPCSKQQAELEHSYEQIENCFTEYFFTNGVKQKCCYNTEGKLIQNCSGGGYLLLEDPRAKINEAYQECCDGNESTCKLFYEVDGSNDCAGYSSPQYRTSGGDVRITTIDNVEYDFNGHGEYVFLKVVNESLLIEIRTEYLIPGKYDSTIITAVAIKPRAEDEVINVFLNRTTKTASLYLNSALRMQSNIGRSPPFQTAYFFAFPPSENTLHIAYNWKTVKGSLQIDIEARDFLSIKMNLRGKISDLQSLGLAGSSVNGILVSGNGSQYSSNSSEHDLFDFGESWSLKSVNKSIFNYSLTSGNFSTFNTHHTKPRFLEDLIGNLTALFNGSTQQQIDKYYTTCEGNNECLLAIARSGDIRQGQLIMDGIRQEQLHQEILENTPPYFFTNWTKLLNISYENKNGISLDLSKFAGDKEDSAEQLRFDVETDINTTDFNFTNGKFNWTFISPALRYEDIVLKFVVTDHLNRSSRPVSFTILYCGCEKNSQCNYGDVAISGDKFRRVDCSCRHKWLKGHFCETELLPCDVIHCFENVTCNNDAVDKDHPCGPCPTGYVENGDSCTDIDECSAGGHCEQNCNNTDGSFICSCRQGYVLSEDRHHCADVNECGLERDDCSSYQNTRCRNVPGGFVCDCKPKYHKARSGSGNCEQGGFSYVTQLKLDVTSVGLTYKTNTTLSQTENKRIQTQLTALFQRTENVVSVEVVSAHFVIIEARKRKREVSHKLIYIDFIVITENQTTTGALSKDLIQTIQNNASAKIWNVSLAGLDLNGVLKVIPEEDNKLCDLTANTCDKESTDCKERNGTTFCECKHPGFTADEYGVDFCKDVDECKNSTYLGTNTSDDRCYHGTCRNTHGSWTCDCPDDLIWKRTGEDFYRCMGDYQYVGNISYFSDFPGIVNASKLRKDVGLELTETFNTSTDNIIWNLTMNETFIRVEVLNLEQNKIVLSSHEVVLVSIDYILHIGVPVTWETVADIQNLSFANRDWNHLNGNNIKAFIYDEKEYSICDIPRKTDCDAVTTACTVTDGAYYCNCKKGYMKPDQMKRDNSKFCTDVDECALNNCSKAVGNCCSNHGDCVNTIGHWTCKCKNGFEVNHTSYDKITCDDVDECAVLGEDACGVNGKCVNLSPGWNCDCPTGFQNTTLGNSHTCTDVDECELYNCSTEGNCCSGHGTCSNTFGNWTCLCSPGYETSYHSYSSISCDDINECEHNETYTCMNGHCSNTDGSWDCSCDDGYRLQNISIDVRICKDIDECSSSSYQCLQGDCLNLQGSWSCVCPQGYRNTTVSTEDNISTVRCNNINECNQTSYGFPACLESTACVDTNGSWNCLCRAGLTAKPLNSTTKICGGDYQFVRIIEFTLVENDPDLETLKTEIEKMLLQMYLKGLQNHTENIYVEVISIQPVARARQKRQTQRDYTADYIVHTDVYLTQTTVTNVLKEELKTCYNSSCSDKKIGAYSIIIRNNPSLLSHTIDLCELPSKDFCDHKSTNCSEKNNAIECICKDGYTEDTFSSTSCKDMDECKDPSRFICSGNTTGDDNGCVNNPGGWTCNCQAGFTPHRYGRFNVTCEDIDECNDDSGNYSCTDSLVNSNAANCSNFIGNWSCTCAEGYRRRKLVENKYVCEDIDECQDKTGEYACGDAASSGNSGATCDNTDGGWSCSCAVGYSRMTVVEGKKYNCEDVCDESPCQNNGNCLHGNNGENFTCVCSAGWTGKVCDTKDPESTHLKTILIACGSSAAALIVLLILAICGIWKYRFSARHKNEVPERISLNTFGTRDSWPFRNGNLYTSPDKVSLTSDRDSRRLSIPRARIGNQVQDVYLEETIELRNPAPDYDLRHSSGVLNPAPDYGPEDSPVMRRKNSDPRDKRGSHNRPSNKKYQEPANNRNSVPAGLNNAYSYL